MSKKPPAIIKRDTRENWRKSSYVPKENVIIIMDNDDGTVSLMFGDGRTNVNFLPDIFNTPLDQSNVDDNTLILH